MVREGTRDLVGMKIEVVGVPVFEEEAEGEPDSVSVRVVKGEGVVDAVMLPPPAPPGPPPTRVVGLTDAVEEVEGVKAFDTVCVPSEGAGVALSF